MDNLKPPEKRDYPFSKYSHRVPLPPFRESFLWEPYLYAVVGTIMVCFLWWWEALAPEGFVLVIISIWGLFGQWRSCARWIEIHEKRNEIAQEAKRITHSDDYQKRVRELESHLQDLEARREEWLKSKATLTYRFLQRSERHQWEHWPLWDWYLQKSEELRMIHAVKVEGLLVYETEDGVLVRQSSHFSRTNPMDGRQHSSWIPRSQIHQISKCSTEDSGSVGTIITMPCWLCEDEQLDYK